MFSMEAPLAALSERADLGPWERCFVRLLEQVWQVAPEVSPSEAWVHFADGDAAWFRRHAAADVGDSEEEAAALAEWLRLRTGPGQRPAKRSRQLFRELEGIHGALKDDQD